MRRRCTDAALTYHAAGDRWFLKAYGKNLGDKRYRVASQSVATLWTHTQFGEPRAYRLQFGMNLGTEDEREDHRPTSPGARGARA